MHKALVLLGLLWGQPGCTGPLPAAGSAQVARVRPAIDVLLSDSLALVQGKRVGLVTNPAGVDAHRVPTLERLRGAGVRVTTLFGPEHGVSGRIDVNTPVEQRRDVDSASGLPVYTLHTGIQPIAPTPEMLAEVDVLVVDLQDVGARYFTYSVTTALVMAGAASAHLPVVVLDRPNPIGGLVQGNVLPGVTPSAVARFPLAMRHGMTLGEISRLARSVLELTTELHVVPVDGWRRSMTLDQTGLPFVPPSL
ncbi:MAG: exo-beta-N-acetylmuramidase NamZ domain-containing protein, partial [Gemmatimonadales bacterium]